jgi:hypothetical protein
VANHITCNLPIGELGQGKRFENALWTDKPPAWVVNSDLAEMTVDGTALPRACPLHKANHAFEPAVPQMRANNNEGRRVPPIPTPGTV